MGVTWTEKLTPNPTNLPQAPWGYVDHSVDANGNIYVVVGRSLSFSLYVSSDGGGTWSRYDNNQIARFINLEANTTSVVMVGYDIVSGAPYHSKIIRSTNGGINFSVEVDLYTLGEITIPYPTLKHLGTKFVFTYCAMHDITGLLSWMVSTDDGDNWVEETTFTSLGYAP